MKNPFEQAFESAAGPEVDYCPVCRGPLSSKAHVVVIPMLREGEKLGSCPACGRPVDAQGRCVCKEGTRIVEYILCGSAPKQEQ